jgi:hypothetical protein
METKAKKKGSIFHHAYGVELSSSRLAVLHEKEVKLGGETQTFCTRVEHVVEVDMTGDPVQCVRIVRGFKTLTKNLRNVHVFHSDKMERVSLTYKNGDELDFFNMKDETGKSINFPQVIAEFGRI